MPDGTGILKGTKLRRAMIPFAALAFLLAQLLIGFHHHSDAELKRGDGHLPAAECMLCLAAHLPFDINDEPPLVIPGEIADSGVTPLASDVAPVAVSARHNPRAPPLIP